jgi:hypothetical protein
MATESIEVGMLTVVLLMFIPGERERYLVAA